MTDPNFPTNLNIHPLILDQQRQQQGFNPIDEWNQQENIAKYGIAGRVWEAGQPLLEYLTPGCTKYDPPCSIFSSYASSTPLKIIELGSGQSLPSLHLASNLIKDDLVVLTDLPNVMSLCEASVKTWARGLDQAGKVDRATVVTRPMAWGGGILHLKEFGRWTHILMCDLVYFPNLYPPLLRTLLQLTEPELNSNDALAENETFGPEIIISYKSRTLSLEESFFHSLSLYFKLSPITGGDGSVRLYICRRWRVSSGWELPSLDRVMNGSQGVLRGREWNLEDELFGELEWET